MCDKDQLPCIILTYTYYYYGTHGVSINADPVAGEGKLKRNIAPRARCTFFTTLSHQSTGRCGLKKKKTNLLGMMKWFFIFHQSRSMCVPAITHNKGVLDMF